MKFVTTALVLVNESALKMVIVLRVTKRLAIVPLTDRFVTATVLTVNRSVA